jgi:tetratricopeptide (TPR) repeat protein
MPMMPADTPEIRTVLQTLPRLLSAGDWSGARARIDAALPRAPDHPALNAFAAFVSDRLGDRQRAVQHARLAAKAGPAAARPCAQAANLLARFRLFDEALQAARSLDLDTVRDPVIADQLGSTFTACGDHEEARRAYEQLVALVPRDPRCRFNLAAAQRFVGDRAAAASNFDQVLAANPHHGEAWYARALVAPATKDNNRVEILERLGSDSRLGDVDAAAIQYALGKELEDLGRWPEAFEAWSKGATAMRRHRPYQVQPELDAIAKTIETWPHANGNPGRAELTPVFVVSLPRAGSTLFERILSSHPQIRSAGETEDFIISLLADPALAGAQDPITLAERTKQTDLRAIGERYREALKRRGFRTGHVIDKTPTNFLYAGLIAEALPEAQLIHVDRDPMDAALATFKTLFRDRYFWSYSLDDIADYIAAKQGLMAHWESGWPDRIHRVAYEDIVGDTETVARRLIDQIDLDWDQACLDFTGNTAPVATASADQVRQPVHNRSVAHWRHFEAELVPVRERLSAKGIL